ncbi:hypothetical protein LCGC14_2745280 [marine sediment metagenome]|uniref:Uncharacterized protein n=1 Tax=marine sediment metagenome TaxID=412755 RepID=A0A0F9BC55_9ZZZZ
MNTLTTLSFRLTSCCVCGVLFGMPEDLSQSLQGSKDPWWCPNGDQQNYLGKSTQEQLSEANRTTRELRDKLYVARDEAARKGKQLTALRRRARGKK